jgi:hypothetical protein
MDMYLQKYEDEDGREYYKYTKTEYVAPNLIQNVINNAEFKSASSWRGSKYLGEELLPNNTNFKPITCYNGNAKYVR